MALADNKVKIQALLAGINALPNAGSGEAPAPVLQEKSVTPSETAQTVRPDTGYNGLSAVTVGAISSTYVGSGVARQAAQTITPGTADKTIASGQYLTGTQTIKGDSNLAAGNIKRGISIFGVAGTYEGSGGGGGGEIVGTCSVFLRTPNFRFPINEVAVISDASDYYVVMEIGDSSEYEIEDVPCNASLLVKVGGTVSARVDSITGGELKYSTNNSDGNLIALFKLSATPGGWAEIYFTA